MNEDVWRPENTWSVESRGDEISSSVVDSSFQERVRNKCSQRELCKGVVAFFKRQAERLILDIGDQSKPLKTFQ